MQEETGQSICFVKQEDILLFKFKKLLESTSWYVPITVEYFSTS